MFYNNFKLLVNVVLLLLAVAIIISLSRWMQGCHFLTSLINQILDGIHNWHRMTFVKSMHGQCCYMQIQPMANIRFNDVVDD